MQLQQQPFLEIEQESHHRSALAAISLACLLLVIAKGSSLLQYWQQTHHILMEVNSPPAVGEFIPGNRQFSHWRAAADHWLDERSKRMLLAGQLLLAGDKALPQPELPVVETPRCPEPVAPAIPACATPVAAESATNPVTGNLSSAGQLLAEQLLAEQPGAEQPGAEQLQAEQSPAPVIANISLASTPAGVSTSSSSTVGTVAATGNEIPLLAPNSLLPPTEGELAAANGPIGLHAGDRILLVGDSLMQGVAPHLITALKRNYNVESMDLSRHSTGLTYPAFFDWPATVKAAFELEQYQVVIVFLGANDPWDMNLQGKYVRFGSARWKEVYSARVQHIIRTTAEYNARLIWLGAPPMGREDLVGKEPLLNEIYASESSKYPLLARFIATAPSLSADGHSFTKFLELPERGSVMVRTDDGVHFTTQGQKLLAKLTLAQFTQAAPALPAPREHQPVAEPTAAPEIQPDLPPAPAGEPPPNQQPNPAISQR